MHPSRTRSALLTVVSLIALVVAGLAFAAPANAADADVKINEFSSNNPDFVELINTGSATVNLTGWVLKDNTENNSYTFPAGSSIAAGAIKGISGEGVEFAFGLGNGDSVRLYAPGGVLIDSYDFPAHPPAGRSYGRCPDGSGAIGLTVAATKGAPNACSTPNTAVRINEFSSNNPDFVELYNTGSGTVDLSGWVLKDNSENNSYTFPAGSSIAGGAYKALSGEGVEFAFGLGGGDSVRLYAPGGVLIDSYDYPAHPPAGKSYGRCPAGTGAFVITAAATKGAANSCPLPTGASSVKINEVQSDPNDLVELVNTSGTPVDISGYRLKDNDDTHLYSIAAGTTLAANGYAVFDVNVSFGLGKGDSVRLYTPDGANLLDSTTYPADTHAANWGRCPDGTGDFGAMTDSLGATNACGPTTPVVPDVKINEVESNGDQVADWVELKNNGAAPANISGWKILDNDPAHAATPVVVPAGTTVPAGGYYAIYTEIGQTPGFGLGGADSATLLLPDGTTQVDSYSWTAHAATTYGRCPDGTGSFTTTTTPTRGLGNACSPVRINEIESNQGTPGDWIELKNISSTPVDVAGWSVKDNVDADSYAIPAGTTIAANGYLVLDEAQFGFGLGGADSVRLYDATGTLIESYAWTAHALQSYGRCKDGLGGFVDTRTPTKGAANACPGLDTQPWPGAQTVTTADLTETFVQDLSGLVFDPADPDVLWGAQNKKGTLFKLVRDANDNFVPAAGWPKDPKYADGGGAPDTEGITIGPDGFVYLASERNNDASGVSRMSILRYDPTATGSTITATREWDLTSQIPAAGANLGLEGVTWIPDSYLVANGFKDQSTGAAYQPSSYPNHGTGLYVVAVEATGNLHAFALDSNGTTSHKVATIDSGFSALADVDFDPELGRLRAVTDDTVDGKTSLLKIDGTGSFVVDAAYDRPVGMPNLNNEGLAVAPQSRCVAGKKEVLWSDDGDSDGHSLRRGSISCSVPDQAQNVAFTSAAPQGAVVGQAYAVTTSAGGSGNPVVLSIAPASSAVCSVNGSTVRLDHPGTCTINATQAAAPGFLAGSASQDVSVAKAATSTGVGVTANTITAGVAVTSPGSAVPGGTVEFRVDGAVVGSAPVSGGSATLTYTVPTGADRHVTATYSGNDDLLGSSGSVVRTDPTITAAVTSAEPRNAAGWYRTPVTVTFTCTPNGAALTAPCPAPVTLGADGAGQAVSRSISAVDGGGASATAGNIQIDRTAPTVALTRVRENFVYIFGGDKPPAECVPTDALSGVASCTVTHTHVGSRWTSTAVALDVAGNKTTYAVSYTALVLLAKN